MFNEDTDAIYEPSNIFIWFVLGFQGGILNVGGYLAVHRFVSHITGFATLFGDQFSKTNLTNALGMLLVPFIFLFGVIVSAIFIERQRLLNKSPKYTLIFTFIIANLIFLTIAGATGHLGTFGEEFSYDRDYIVLFLLAYTCGLQNAVISSASKSIIRTTHITGPTTDLGIGLVKMWTLRKELTKKDHFVIWCRFGIIISFIFGSLVGAYLFKSLEFYGFIFPALISIYAAFRLRGRAKAAL